MSHLYLETRNLETGPIKREELDDGSVVYRHMALISEGVWTDAGSGQPTLYDPQELKVVEDNAVNIAHDSNNEVSEVGHIKADSWTVEGDKGYADVVLDMDSPASEYADENLQTALESGGQKGFGGPSIEIPAGSYDLEEDTATGYPKLVDGKIHGVGLVMSPASKSTSFAHQVSQQGVAMSADSQNPMVFTLEDGSMPEEKLLEKLREEYNLGDDVDAATIKALNEAGALSLEDKDGEESEGEEGDEEEESSEEEEDVENEDGEEESEESEEEEEGDDMEERMSALEERLTSLEEMAQQAMQAEDLDEELEEAKQDLADADTVNELQEAKEDLEKRLSELEEEPEKPKSLSEDAADNDDVEYSHISPSQSRGY